MSIDTTTELQHAVEDAAAHLYVWALKDIPQDLRDALKSASERETSVPGQRVLSTILRNVEVADSEGNLVWGSVDARVRRAFQHVLAT